MKRKKLPGEIFSLQFLVLMSYSSIAILTLLPLFFEYLGGSPKQIGFLVGIFSFAAFVSRPFGGWLLSRVDPKKVMRIGLVFVLIVTSFYLFVQRLDWFVIALRIFHGLGFSIFILAGLLIAVLLVREEQRAYAIGVVSTGFMIPLLIVPAMGEEIIQRFGFPCFFLSAILLSAIPVVYALFAPIQLPHEEDEEELVGAGFFKLLSQRKIFFIFLLTFVFEIGLSSSLTFVPLLAHQESAMRAGYFYSFLGMTAVFMRLFGGRWLKFWGSPKVLLPAFYFLCGGSALVFLARTSWMLGLSGIVWGIGVGFLYPHLSALSVERVSNREKGKVLSLFASSVDLGFALGPLFFGWISQAIGIRLTFLPLALIIFLSSSLLIWVGRSALVKTKSGETSPFCPDE